MAVLAGACGPDIRVRTAVAPEAVTLGSRQTFKVVEAKNEDANGNGRANGNGNGHGQAKGPDIAEGYGVKDPMVDNSITAQALHNQIKAAFEARGYRYSNDKPNFIVSYRATIAPILDVRTYNTGGYYGYRGYDGYYGGGYGYDGYGANGGFGYAVGTFDRGTVIIDAIDPGTQKLLWRGQGTAGSYTEPKRYLKELKHAVNAVVKKFPVAAPNPMVAGR